VKPRYAVALALLVSFVLLSPRIAAAGAGVPLVAVFLPPLWLALAPIIVVEAFVNSRILSLPFRRTLLPATLGNIASTIVGIPLIWLFFATLEMLFFSTPEGLATAGAKVYAVTVQSPWLIPYEKDLRWMVPAALLFFSIPCFAVSVLVEAPINGFGLPTVARRAIWKATAKSNLASYLCLGAMIGGMLALQGTRLDSLYNFFSTISEWIVEIVVLLAKVM